MNFSIKSGKYISYDIAKMIMDILSVTHCPWEVFKTCVPDYTSFDGHTIQLAEGDKYHINIACNALFKEDELKGL